MNVSVIDTLEVAKELSAAGFTNQQAEAVTRQLRLAQNVDLSSLATKDDLAALAASTKADIAALAASTKADIAALAASTKADTDSLKADVKSLKADVNSLKADMAALRTDMTTFMVEMRAEMAAMRADMAAQRLEWKTDIADAKFEIIKWVVGLGVAYFALTFTMIKLLH